MDKNNEVIMAFNNLGDAIVVCANALGKAITEYVSNCANTLYAHFESVDIEQIESRITNLKDGDMKQYLIAYVNCAKVIQNNPREVLR